MTTTPRTRTALLTTLAAMLPALCAVALSGCIAVGGSSRGGFFMFPSIGVLFVILILFLLLRRR